MRESHAECVRLGRSGYITCKNNTYALEGTTVIDTNSISNE